MSQPKRFTRTVVAAATSTRRPRRLLRRVGAVAAGLVAIFAVTTVTDLVMHATGVYPPPGAPPMSNALFLLAFAYRFVFDVAAAGSPRGWRPIGRCATRWCWAGSAWC